MLFCMPDIFSGDDSYIEDLEAAGQLFEQATDSCKAGRAAEAVPLFMQALKEFERLELPELPLVQSKWAWFVGRMVALNAVTRGGVLCIYP
jgi:hypothetical protein